MLNWIVKGLLQWFYGMIWQMGEYIMNALMDVFNMDMNYFNTAVPISDTIMNIMFGVGWALLIGNLVFQAAKAMMSGIGFEGEDPRTLGFRTMVFAFLLVYSRQICGIGLSLGATVVDLLQVPSSVILPSLADDMFGIDASWFLMIIVGIIILFQLVKFFFEVGERYVIVGVLTILSPLAFAMGGSRNTMEIFKGWARMYGSMCLMLVMNVVFMKLIISAMSIFPHGLMVFPWLILIIALARVARKIDNIIARIGLNPAITGDGLGRGFPGMMAMMVSKSLISGAMGGKFGATKAAAGAAKSAASGAAGRASGFTGGARPAPSPVNTGGASGGASASGTVNTGFGGNVNQANANPAAGSSPEGGTPVNPPVGRARAAQQGRQSRPGGTQPSAVHTGSATGRNGKPARGGIAVSADDEPGRKPTGDSSISRPPHASRVNAAESAKPLDTSKGSGLAGERNASAQDKPARPPRGSGDAKPVDTSGDSRQTIPPIGGAGASPVAPAPVNTTASTQSQRETGANAAGRSSTIQNGGVSPVHTNATNQSTQQGARAQVNAVSSQGGTLAQSHAHATQEGAQVHQDSHQSTQNLNRGASSEAPQPVSTHSVGNTPAGSTPSALHLQASSAPAPAPVSAAQTGKAVSKSQPLKSTAKANNGAAAQEPKTAPKPLDLRTQGKQAESKQDAAPGKPLATGKNQTPAPIDIGTDAPAEDKSPVPAEAEIATGGSPAMVTEDEQ